MALEHIRLQEAKFLMHTFGDAAPRRVERCSADINIWPGNTRVELELVGRAVMRRPDSMRLTMPTTDKRHLRTAPSPAEVALLQQVRLTPPHRRAGVLAHRVCSRMWPGTSLPVTTPALNFLPPGNAGRPRVSHLGFVRPAGRRGGLLLGA